MDFAAMFNRVMRAAMLDVHLYEEVEADTCLLYTSPSPRDS